MITQLNQLTSWFRLKQSREARLLGGLLVLVSLAGYWAIQTQVERYQTLPLLTLYALLFSAYLVLGLNRRHFSLISLLGVGLLFRLLLFGGLPSLSDDFYRFLWDGHLLLRGYHPFAEVPRWYWTNSNLLSDPYLYQLFSSMNSPDYHTIYPPLAQGVFALSAALGGSSLPAGVSVLRIIFLLAELVATFQLLDLLSHWGWPKRNIAWLVLNPLLVLEGVGNLHPEILLLPFLLLLLKGLLAAATGKKRALSLLVIGFSGAVAAKLWPLLFGPYIVLRLGWKKGLLWMGLSALLLLLLFSPLLAPVLTKGYSASLGLYFQRFEFNASAYYLLRELGTAWMGYNPIASLAPVLAGFTGLLILFISFKAYAGDWPPAQTLFGLYLVFLVGSTVVHPWYVLPLLVLTPLVRWRGALLWSALIGLTYAGYSRLGYTEFLGLILLEYLLVFGYFLFVDKIYSIKPLRK